MNNAKVVVIGGGPGGYVTAIRLNQLGIDTVVFEKERLGGVCLNWGCIPTKALVKVAELYHEIKNADSFGIDVENAKPNYTAIAQRKENVVDRLVSGVEYIFKKREIPIINEKVIKVEKKENSYVVSSENKTIETDYIILATGSVPKELPFMKFDGESILASKDLLSIKEIPESLAVVGGGVVGCEFASIFSSLGSKVHVIEFLPDLVPNEDAEISKRLQRLMKKNKIKVKTKTAVESYSKNGDNIVLNLSKGKPIEAQKVLVSVGRKAQIDIDFGNINIEMNNDAVVIDEKFRTSEKNIFAIGDLTEKLMLAHTASKQGVIVANIINAEMKKLNVPDIILNYENIPKCTFTHPEIGSVGLTTQQAENKFDEILTGKFTFAANGKALGSGATDGFVKVVADAKSKKIVGVHIIGPAATELVAVGTQIIATGMTIEETEKIVWAHPTLSEAMAEAIEDLENFSIHKI